MSIFKQLVQDYINQISPEEDDVLRKIKSQIIENKFPTLSSTEGKFLQMMTRLSGGNRVLELGSGYGYSTVWLSRGLAFGGKLTSFEYNEDVASAAKKNIAEADFSDNVDIVAGKSSEYLKLMEPGFDLIFMDEYKDYYVPDLIDCVPLLRDGGIFLAHNAFEGGWVSGKVEDDLTSDKLRAFHKAVLNHPELDSIIIPIGEGFAFGVKKAEG